ncbi:hypothetical protein [Pseudomonas panipatensis]|uniref:DnaT DNA-binding domain-containing protein n=1 Tax=Pseudomonas panipatensis TaxID=428992 RepID=A0A1G8HJZ1_9PSED|nr:hypothetical protein [Pseudomonas panipatensis]SDI06821.1 hypothetical protein SAMN05216272_105272 [Pseudomonas panipatensis]SMP58647.1 hypothetical protein SAMN06295951_104273 [Pseudomonas panipatensis]
MARARNIKPSFFKNEDLADLHPFDRLLFIGLWCLADREGRLEDRPRRIKIELFPGDSYDVEIGLANLLGKGFIERYEVASLSVISLPNFVRHQSPHSTEKDSELPDCNGYLTVNERIRGKVVPGKQRFVHAETGFSLESNNGDVTVKASEQHASATVDASTHNALIPDSLNPDYLNPEEEQEPPLPPEGDAADAAGDQGGPAPKPKRQKRDSTFDPLTAKPGNVSADTWAKWVQHRREIRKPLTPTSCSQQAAQLATHPNPDSVIAASIASGWQGLFPDRVARSTNTRPSNFTNLPKHTPDQYQEESDHDGPNF